MDNKINQNSINNVQFNAVKSKAAVNKGAVKMEDLIKNTIEKVLERAEREVPEYGSFRNVAEKFKNTDKNLVVDEFKLEIFQPPKGVENYEIKRALKFAASKPNSDTAVEILIESGSKEDILNKLKDGKLIDELKSAAENLSYNLEDL